MREQNPGEVWHSGYFEHRIRDLEDFDAQKRYIANNPTRRQYDNYPHVHTQHPNAIDPAPAGLWSGALAPGAKAPVVADARETQG